MRRRTAVLVLGALLFGAVPATAQGDPGIRTLAVGEPGVRTIGKPKVTMKLIPFGPKRKRETRIYAKRHYGIDSWHLKDPRMIVEHYTGSNTFESAYNTFASDSKHLGEFPGVCAHFIIDKDGTIYQIVDPGIICRHTIGLNWTAIGIEHVGTSDRQVMGNAREMSASLRLTVWLMQTYGISIGNVIGHSESLTAPLYTERIASYRCLTHSDWSHKHMTAYRRRAKRIAKRRGVPVGAPYEAVDSGC